MDDQYSAFLKQARRDGVRALDEPQGKKLLKEAGIIVPDSVTVNEDSDLHFALKGLRAPYALKVVASGVVHKSDVGGVRLGLRSVDQLALAIAELSAELRADGITPRAWLVEEMAPAGIEVVVGGVMDEEFGPMVMVGLGGVFVEVLKDFAFRICPIEPEDAREMLAELRGEKLLYGVRGGKPVNVDAIVDVLLCVGGENGLLVRGAGDLAELDINPLIVSGTSAVAVDARFILKSE